MELDLTLHVQSDRWKTCLRPYVKTVRDICDATLQETVLVKKQCVFAMSVVLTDDATITELNHTYRGKKAATNVLSFPDVPDLEAMLSKPTGKLDVVELGDVVLALETIQREAKDQHKVFKQHVMHLLVHGTLHLLGYDHDNKRDAEHMEQKEIKILKKQGVGNPYLS